MTSTLRWLSILLMFLPWAAAAGAQPAAALHPWADAAGTDLQAIHDLIENNHPGPVDPDDPGFRNWLDRGVRFLRARAGEATTQDEYRTVLRDYVNGFADGHLGITFTSSEQMAWPGFLTRTNRPDGVTRVMLVDGAAGVVPDEILEQCDGTPVDRLLSERVLRPLLNPAVPQQLLLVSPWLMVVGADDAAAQAKQCRFRDPTGREHDVPLDWRPIHGTTLQARLQDASGVETPPLGLRRVGDVWLVSIPSFTWPGADAKLMQQFVITLRSRAAELHAARHVVIDLRGNGGGNSAWGEDVASALWNREMVDAVTASEDGTVDWRVSSRNLGTIRAEVADMRAAGHGPEAAAWNGMAVRMQTALAAKQALLRMDETPQPLPSKPMVSPFLHPVLILTEPHCASSCLDFLDLLGALPGTERIGLPTSADTDYLDLASAPLPSGRAMLDYAMKVYRHRVRGSNVAYMPAVGWPGGVMTDAAIARWVDSFGS